MTAPATGLTTSTRAGAVRRIIEGVLRALALAVLAWMLWRSSRPAGAEGPTRAAARGDSLPAALVRWSVRDAAESLHVGFDTVPSPRTRDWLVALRRAGRQVGWDGASLPATAVAVERVAAPRGGVRVLAAAPSGAAVAVGDAAGVLDTLRAAAGGSGAGVAFATTLPLEMPAATVAGTAARAPRADSLRVGRVLVLGAAGWESKFVLAALEEDGWAVDARLRVSPTVEVSQGTRAELDTARYAAAVVLDSGAAAAYGAALVRFARRGGGVVIAGDAARAPALRDIAAAAAGDAVPGVAGALSSDSARRGLGLVPLARLAPDAVALERRGGTVAAAARRVGPGRVVQLGYTDSWRWRMLGAEDAPARHRSWWSRVVASVAYAPPVRLSVFAADSISPAPYAALVAALGPPTAAPPATPPAPGAPLPRWAFALVLGALLAEWTSRRLRGAR